MKTYDTFFDEISWLLNQEIEEGDEAAADSYRYLEYDRGKIALNDVCSELFRENMSKFRKTYTYTFDSLTEYFKLPSHIFRLEAAKIGDDGTWNMISDESDINATIKIVEQNTLYKSGGWDKGESLVLSIIDSPSEIIEDNDMIDEAFDGYIELLRLMVKETALARKGDSISELELRKIARLRAQWINDTGKIKKKSLYAFRGHGFGRR
jgi:hypothetical protein